jgi:hypothetical protein
MFHFGLRRQGLRSLPNSAFPENRIVPKSKRIEVPMDRRIKSSDRRGAERRTQTVAVAVERRQSERRVKVPRRRQIDPTTCERDYSGDEIEFMQALDAYKRANGRMFPTCSEILEVIRALGYVRLPPGERPPGFTAPVLSATESMDNGDEDFE